jgi:hypothetical protein
MKLGQGGCNRITKGVSNSNSTQLFKLQFRYSLDIGKVHRANGTTLKESTAFTVLIEGEEGHSPEPTQRETSCMGKQVLADSHRERISTPVRACLVKLRENITMAPRSQQVVIRKLEFEREHEPTPGV